MENDSEPVLEPDSLEHSSEIEERETWLPITEEPAVEE